MITVLVVSKFSINLKTKIPEAEIENFLEIPTLLPHKLINDDS